MSVKQKSSVLDSLNLGIYRRFRHSGIAKNPHVGMRGDAIYGALIFCDWHCKMIL